MLVFVPRSRAMTLQLYLIPQAFPEARIPPIRTVEDVTVPSTATHRFVKLLRHGRIFFLSFILYLIIYVTL
jgi:hypothetical protein